MERILIALPRRSELLDRMRDENPGATPEELLSKVRQFLAQYVRAEILKVHRQRSKVDAEISDLGVI